MNNIDFLFMSYIVLIVFKQLIKRYLYELIVILISFPGQFYTITGLFTLILY